MSSIDNFDIQRRQVLLAGAALAAGVPATSLADAQVLGDEALLDDLAQRSFNYFWELAHPVTGLVPDRWPTRSFASIAAVGFGLSAYAIGAERGWVTRAAAAERTRRTLRHLHDAPQGPQASGVAGHRGFFYHFLDADSGLRYRHTELSTVDTALLLAGALHARAYFDGADAVETQLRDLADALYARVEWRWAQARAPAISHGWLPQSGFLASDWKGYNEAMLVYLLALGSPTYPVGPEAWGAWTSTYGRFWGQHWGQTYLHFAPFFGHQFTHAWVDFRGLRDAWLGERGLDYWENSRRATLAQRAYAVANPEGYVGYGANAWGVTACDGPADVELVVNGRARRFISYAGRGMGGRKDHDDGTIAPYGAGSSLPFAPELVLPLLQSLRRQKGRHILGRYGFFAFNQTFSERRVPLLHGRVVPGFGWVDTDFLGIEVGPLLLMLANHRDDAVWRRMRGQPWLVTGLQRAGFRGGWLG
jgi:hypothetical protein